LYYLRTIFLLTLTYLALVPNFEILNILAGVLVATIVVLLVRPQAHALRWRNLPSTFVAFVRYAFVLVYDLIVSGIQVARIVLDPRHSLHPGIITIPSKTKSEVAQALNAHAITLTPGEIVVEMDEDGTMYTHCLNATDSEKLIDDAQEMRAELLEKILS
jgi:multisubunit Na+/H+ antiporter MnhE subunit